MTGADYMSALAQLGLNQVTAARFLDVSIRTSHAYANGARIPRAVQLLFGIMIRYQIRPEDL